CSRPTLAATRRRRRSTDRAPASPRSPAASRSRTDSEMRSSSPSTRPCASPPSGLTRVYTNPMRIIRQQTLGGPEVLELTEAATPEPEPTEVLVRVAAAGVNPVDWKTRVRGG